MKVVILAGGRGTRLAEHTRVIPKALVPIGDQPILRHLLNYYIDYGQRQFLVALGYLGAEIRAYFSRESPANCAVQLVDTGLETDTGGRVGRLREHLGASSFLLAWCDGLTDLDLHALLRFHQAHGRLVTVAAVHPPARFGRLILAEDRVSAFAEKEPLPDEWINGGICVVEPGIFAYIDGDASSWERDVLPRLVRDDQLMAFRHEGFWQCMDTIHDRAVLEQLAQPGNAPWCS